MIDFSFLYNCSVICEHILPDYHAVCSNTCYNFIQDYKITSGDKIQ